MFNQNNEFFPTPLKLIEKMLEPYKGTLHRGGGFSRGYEVEGYRLANKMILEPSAGKGDILDFITGDYVLREGKDRYTTENYDWSEHREITSEESCKKTDIRCIERDPELQYLLQGKGYRLIDSDFLKYEGDTQFDLILMNPPFSNGDEHVLKAWSIIENGDIVCLLNAETIRNPYSERRKLLTKIIEDNKGTVEYIQNGFTDAERKTDVEVALVRLTKVTEKTKFDFEFQNISNEKGFNLNEENIKNLPETLDIVGNMILQFEETKKYFLEYLKVSEALKFYCEPIVNFNQSEDRNIMDMIKRLSGSKRDKFNEFTDEIRSDMWEIVIGKLGMERYMTESVRKNFNSFTKKQGAMQFTKENISNLIQMLLMNGSAILEKAIVEVFDSMTSYYKENRLHVEGWKTNDSWKVNRKVIFPNGVDFDNKWSRESSNGAKFTNRWQSYTDIDKVMCYITGVTYENCMTIHSALERQFHCIGYIKPGDKFDNACRSSFFNIKFWKKGTLHLEFIDPKLWEEFNIRACKDKNWLPPGEWEAYQAKNNPQPEPLAEEFQIAAPIEKDGADEIVEFVQDIFKEMQEEEFFC